IEEEPLAVQHGTHRAIEEMDAAVGNQVFEGGQNVLRLFSGLFNVAAICRKSPRDRLQKIITALYAGCYALNASVQRLTPYLGFMPNIAAYHPQIVHFTIALLVLGVAFRWVSLTGKVPFASPTAATLLLLGAIAALLAVHSG